MAEDAGFKSVEIKPFGGVLICIADLMCKCTSKVPLAGLVTYACWHGLLSVTPQRLKNAASDVYPIAYSVVLTK